MMGNDFRSRNPHSNQLLDAFVDRSCHNLFLNLYYYGFKFYVFWINLFKYYNTIKNVKIIVNLTNKKYYKFLK